MNDNSNSLVGLEIWVSTTKNNRTYLAFKFDGKHYKAWINEKTEIGASGKPWITKIATVRVCDFEKCSSCENGQIRQFWPKPSSNKEEE